MTLYAVYRNLTEIAPLLSELFEKLDQTPENPRIHFEIGSCAHQSGLLALASECYARVTELAPRVDAGFFNLGNVLFELGRFDEAKTAYASAMRLSPESGTLINLGNCCAATQDWEIAVNYFDQAISRADCSAEDRYRAFGNRGKALIARGDWDAAIANYRAAIEAFPRDATFRGTKARCHQHRLEYSKAMECLIEAIEIYPTHPGILCQIADVNFARGRTTESLLCLERAFSIEPPSAEFHSHWIRMLVHYPAVSPERLRGEAERWTAIHAKQSAKAAPVPGVQERAIPNVIRVGVLIDRWQKDGCDLGIPTLLPHFVGDRVHWFIYVDDRGQIEFANAPDGVVFVSTSHLSDEALAARIRDDHLDVLIDQIGHGDRTRLRTIAMKPAPVQVSWNAFPTTSGVPEMDCVIADSYLIPDRLNQHFSERVVRLPKTSLFFKPNRDAGAMDGLGLIETDPFTIGCFAAPASCSEDWLQSLASVLKMVEHSVALFVGPTMNDSSIQGYIQTVIEQSGVLPERIKFFCEDISQDPARRAEVFRRVDVSLDPFPFGSPAIAFQALAMGVPVVTKLEERLAGRAVASMLNQLGRTEWIATSNEAYVEVVHRIASERQMHLQRRKQLSTELLATPMCNLDEVAASVEQMLIGLAKSR